MSVEMKILANHAEWLENRKNGIGGSEISAVVGCNPYLNNVELWKLKTGKRQAEDISEKPYVKYGTKSEEHLRELFKLDFPEYSVEYVENNSFRNNRFPWAQASLDGWLTDQEGRKGILEIKTTEILQSMQREKWKNQIPQNYYCQVLFYMAVLEADFAVLKAQLKTVFDGVPYLQTKHFKIEREEVQDDIDYLMDKGAEFWKYVEKGNKPPLILPDI
jgi:putative phage-type endonuclease